MPVNKRTFIYLSLGFMFLTVAGTLLHETGHYLMARWFGYDAHISHGFTYYDLSATKTLWVDKELYIITLAGPLQTILTGTIGLLLLFVYRKDFYKAETLSFAQWLVIFISLFWLRQFANFFIASGTYLFTREWPTHSDEYRLATFFDVSPIYTSGLTALIALMVLTIVVFKFIPVKERLVFCLSGIVGGVLGYVVWFRFLGKWLMP